MSRRVHTFRLQNFLHPPPAEGICKAHPPGDTLYRDRHGLDNRRRVRLPLLCRFSTDHSRVTGDFHALGKLPERKPYQGMKPVNTAQRISRSLNKIVLPAQMLFLMLLHMPAQILRRIRRYENPRPPYAENKRFPRIRRFPLQAALQFQISPQSSPNQDAYPRRPQAVQKIFCPSSGIEMSVRPERHCVQRRFPENTHASGGLLPGKPPRERVLRHRSQGNVHRSKERRHQPQKRQKTQEISKTCR